MDVSSSRFAVQITRHLSPEKSNRSLFIGQYSLAAEIYNDARNAQVGPKYIQHNNDYVMMDDHYLIASSYSFYSMRTE